MPNVNDLLRKSGVGVRSARSSKFRDEFVAWVGAVSSHGTAYVALVVGPVIIRATHAMHALKKRIAALSGRERWYGDLSVGQSAAAREAAHHLCKITPLLIVTEAEGSRLIESL